MKPSNRSRLMIENQSPKLIAGNIVIWIRNVSIVTMSSCTWWKSRFESASFSINPSKWYQTNKGPGYFLKSHLFCIVAFLFGRASHTIGRNFSIKTCRESCWRPSIRRLDVINSGRNKRWLSRRRNEGENNGELKGSKNDSVLKKMIQSRETIFSYFKFLHLWILHLH